ncbi:MAG: hypothetical protein QW177_04205 [Candidatus Nitrosotenuis sp.]
MISSILVILAVPMLVMNAYGLSITDLLGDVTDLAYDQKDLYFFEVDRTVQSQAWIPDTRVVKFDGENKLYLSYELFIYPTELVEREDYLYFVALDDSCVGSITCDFQNLVRISKTDGTKQILERNLKSAAHLHIDSNFLYISESNGSIWRINLDDLQEDGILRVSLDGSKELIYRTDNIILDMVAKGDHIFWIEEVDEDSHQILSIQHQNVVVVYDKPHLPHSLDVSNGMLRWSETHVRVEGDVGDYTIIQEFDGKNVKKIFEFKNTSSVAILGLSPHYKPYRLAGDYIFLVNNTHSTPSLHMVHIYNGTNTTIEPSMQGRPVFLRAEDDKLFSVGKTENAFSIEQYSLPVTIPEFPLVILILVAGLLFTVNSRFVCLFKRA